MAHFSVYAMLIIVQPLMAERNRMNKSIQAYLIWFIATLFVVYAFCLNTAAAVFSDTIKTSLHTSDFGVSMAVSAFIVGFALMQIPAGYLLDKYNARFVISAGILVLALGNIMISFSNNLILFAFSNFIQGIGASFAFIAAAVLISQWFPSKLFPIYFGLTQTFSCVLAGIIHYILFISLAHHSWNQIYQILAGSGICLFILTLLIVKSPNDLKHAEILTLKQSLTVVCKNSQVWLTSFAAATSFGVLLAYASFWYLRVTNFYAVQLNDAFIISTMIFIGIGIGTPLFGWLSNIYKSRKMILHVTLVLGTMFLLLGLYLPHFDINTLIIAKVIAFLIGFLLSGSMLFYTVVSELSSDATRGVALSVANTTVFLFNTVLLFIPYLFITTASTYFFTYLWVLPFFILLSILLIYFIKETFNQGE